jgi:hypothetical protein
LWSKLAVLVVVAVTSTAFAQRSQSRRANTATEARETIQQPTVPGANQSFRYEEVEITGYTDLPGTIQVIDVGGADFNPIELTRSFREALKENVDMETVTRITR